MLGDHSLGFMDHLPLLQKLKYLCCTPDIWGQIFTGMQRLFFVFYNRPADKGENLLIKDILLQTLKEFDLPSFSWNIQGFCQTLPGNWARLLMAVGQGCFRICRVLRELTSSFDFPILRSRRLSSNLGGRHHGPSLTFGAETEVPDLSAG